MNSKIVSFLLLFFCLINLNVAIAAGFYPVTDGIYRGPRPQESDLVALKKIGIKTVLNIDDDTSTIHRERKMASKLGLKFVSVPLSGFWTPSDHDVDRILATLTAQSLQPVFLHCKHGQDRTGLLVGLYRVFFQNWAPSRAYKEMLDYGFHRKLVFLNHYFEERTGFED